MKLQCAGGNVVHPPSIPDTGDRKHNEGRVGMPVKYCSIIY